MAVPQRFILRVYLNTDIAAKLSLNERPNSVEALKTLMKEKFKLTGDFAIHYEDPDFDGQLCQLIDIEELPEKGTFKILRSESDASSVASSDTDRLPHAPSNVRQKNWPDSFPVPIFSYHVEHALQEGDRVFEDTGKVLDLDRAQKHNILQKLAETIHSFKAYPEDKEIAMAAQALVALHPCLREPGSENGWYGWKLSLKFKMGKYRSLQRIHDLLESWPALRGESQVYAEFHRITNVNLRNTFFSELDRHMPRLLKLYREKASRTGNISQAIRTILQTFDDQEEPDIHMRRSFALQTLPTYLREDGSEFFLISNSQEEPDVTNTPLALLICGSNSLQPEKVSIVVEGEVILRDLPKLTDGLIVLLGLTYVFNLKYPKKLEHTFTFFQKMLLCLDDTKPLSKRLLNLKNDLYK